MQLTRLRSLLLTGATCFVAAVLVGRVLADQRPELLSLPWVSAALLALVAVGLLTLGWPVRQVTGGQRGRTVDPLRAASVLTFAKTCAIVGVALCGAYAGVALICFANWAIPAFRSRTFLAALACVAAAALMTAGLVVERWCRLPPDDTQTTSTS
ncbi:MAG: DUF3180 domain-containing protein [Bifidobacteriaceae bacterium]|jgi:hypothetical protein|nr:DUF3180 domain-containing protein [Bifidobacteriaceae bacterium]